MEITLNQEQKLFVISTGSSYSCLGFRVVYEHAQEMMRRVVGYVSKHGSLRQANLVDSFSRLAAVRENEIGTEKQYKQYETLMQMYRHTHDKETWFDARTPGAVKRVLEAARRDERKLRVFLGDTDTGRDWLEENDVIGRIGRSMGPMRTPLLIADGEIGGGAILTSCLVRILDIETGKELYRHPTYHLPKMQMLEAPAYDQAEGLTHVVNVQAVTGEMDSHASFKSAAKAAHWMAFMAGESFDLRA